jgi:hypothetical protein
MKNPKLTTGGLAVALVASFMGLSGSALVHGAGAQNRNDGRAGQYSGSLDARQHGYEHAYRDGADRGRQDRDSKAGYNFRDNDYLDGARGYQSVFGNKSQYMTGYREGYKAGYDDAYNDRAGQYGQIYGRPTDSSRAPARSDVYSTRSGGSSDMAFDAGYRGGITAGQQDLGRNVRSNFRGTDAYQRADLGYRANYGDKDAYKLQFQDGFERGYQDGYGRSRYSSDGGGYFPTPGRTGAVDTRDGEGASTRSLSVPGNQQWTPTNIRVNQGETMRFQVTGEVRISANANDRAVPAGSVALKYVSGAPLPKAFAGALIGRIDNGRPFGIGDQTSLVMPASGILYLGVNDDSVNDNSGEFKVVLSW